MSEFNPTDLVKGKRVAVVGHASSIFGSGYGIEIDRHDVVVRCNLFDPPEDKLDHTGIRTDLWYAGWVCDAPENIEFTRQGHRYGVPICRTSGTTDTRRLKMINDSWGNYNPLNIHIGDAPSPGCSTSTGLVAVWDCLRCGASMVSVYGMDCWRSNDYQNPLTPHEATLVILKPEVQEVIRADERRWVSLLRDGFPVKYDAVLQALVNIREAMTREGGLR